MPTARVAWRTPVRGVQSPFNDGHVRDRPEERQRQWLARVLHRPYHGRTPGDHRVNGRKNACLDSSTRREGDNSGGGLKNGCAGGEGARRRRLLSQLWLARVSSGVAPP